MDVDKKIEKYLKESNNEELNLIMEGFIKDLFKYGAKRTIVMIEDLLDKIVAKLTTETGDTVVDNRLEKLRKDALYHRQRFMDIMRRMGALNPEVAN